MTEDDRQARALFAAGDFAAAEILFRRVALNDPGNAVAVYNLGVTLAKLDRFEEAAGCYRQAIERDPGFAAAYANFGICLNELNLIAQARQAFHIAHSIAPDDPIPVLNEGIAALALGDYAAGWQGFAARWRLPAYARFERHFDQPAWTGENPAGLNLFLYAEQGFGDSIQMARFIPVLEAKGAQVIVEAPPALAGLLRSVSPTARIIAKGEALPAFDTYAAMMDVPRILGVTLDNLPATTPYLAAEATAAARCAAALPTTRGLNIGLCWAGRSSHENDRNRSLSFKRIAPLLAPSHNWISLQRLVPDADAAALAASPAMDWGRSFPDFAAAAAAIAALDLVITVDTAIAHLAGALGKPVWVMLPFYADWRWLTGRADSPWYPTARLFRQSRRGDWTDIIENIGAALDSF